MDQMRDSRSISWAEVFNSVLCGFNIFMFWQFFFGDLFFFVYGFLFDFITFGF